MPGTDKASVDEVESTEATAERHEESDGSADREKTSVVTLEEEGEIAADYLEELLDIADLDGDIDIDVEHDRAAVAVISDSPRDLKDLVGGRGEVVDALQELTRLAVQTKTGERSRLMLDVAGFRADRKRELGAIAKEAIAQARTSGEPVTLPPANAFERKVVHDVVTAAGFVSESRGTDPHRYVEIRQS